MAGTVFDLGTRGFKTELAARATVAPEPSPGRDRRGIDPAALPAGTRVARVFCRRDDYAFLPPQASAGLPCDTATPSAVTDPRQIARAMFDQMDMPSLRLNMNPRKGMVAVPTWFWIEGYDGDVMPLQDTLVLSHDECRTVVERDGDGHPVLDAEGAPVTRRECQTIADSVVVEVRVWPRHFAWDFGDGGSLVVPCPDVAACTQGVGQPYIDPRTPSPIAHAYRWSSLGANGAADAYTVGLGIAFAAQYRFSVNGGSAGGWQSLGERDLSWSAAHQVQEAQAVLTRP